MKKLIALAIVASFFSLTAIAQDKPAEAPAAPAVEQAAPAAPPVCADDVLKKCPKKAGKKLDKFQANHKCTCPAPEAKKAPEAKAPEAAPAAPAAEAK